MKIKFKDVPAGCRFSYQPNNNSVFEGRKLDDDAAVSLNRPSRTYMMNIPATQEVDVLFKAPWRTRLIMLHHKTQPSLMQLHAWLLKKYTRFTCVFSLLAYAGLSPQERNALTSETSPLAERARHQRLQKRYDEELNRRTPDDIRVTRPTSTGLINHWSDSIPEARR